jgi:transcription antitermination protein NusB
MNHSPNPILRHQSRCLALQSLYQWELTHNVLANIEEQAFAHTDLRKIDVDYFRELLHRIPECVDDLDTAFEPFLVERRLAELDPIELTVLRIATYEMLHRIDVPYRVILGEAIKLSRAFGATDGFKFINAVLDPLARQIRTIEIQG